MTLSLIFDDLWKGGANHERERHCEVSLEIGLVRES